MKFTEQDFQDLANAANHAWSAGRRESALRLDILARKANASLANQRATRLAGGLAPLRAPSISWKKVPSTLPHIQSAADAKDGA